ncbi:MAG: hypothetical protein Q8M86_11080 [Syntrophales bacterium]|nr:hypothetical protein [Syntrophales bacterium]MDP3098484.1 hypothetical protein [Syntrophales bacterium]
MTTIVRIKTSLYRMVAVYHGKRRPTNGIAPCFSLPQNSAGAFFPSGSLGTDPLIRLDGRREGRYTQSVRAVVSLLADFNFSRELAKPFAMKRPNHTAKRRKK